MYGSFVGIVASIIILTINAGLYYLVSNKAKEIQTEISFTDIVNDEYKFVENNRQWESKCGVIMFYHISKTGGTNANWVFQQKIKEYNKDTSTNSFAFQFWNENKAEYNATHAFFNELIPFIRKQLQKNSNKILYIHQHHKGYSFVEFVEKGYLSLIQSIVKKEKKCEFLYVTMLRQPIKFALSILGYNNIPKSEYTIYLTEQYPNYFIGYLNYQIDWECPHCNFTYNCHKTYNLLPTQKVDLNECFVSNTLRLLRNFDIIGLTEKHNEFLLKVYKIANIAYDTGVEFDKSLYNGNQNKASESHKIQNVTTAVLNTIIETRVWDLKLYYSLLETAN